MPVGLFGLAMKTIRVRGVTRARSASTSAVSSRSGAATGVAPTDMRADRVHQKAVPAVQHLVAGAGISAQQQRDQLVRAGAADDPRRVEPVLAADRLAQRLGAAVGIAVDLVGQRPIGGDRLRARAERAFVRGEADRPLDPGDLGLAADIGGDVEDARARRRAGRAVIRVSLSLRRAGSAAARQRHGIAAERQRGDAAPRPTAGESRRGAGRKAARNHRSRSD